MKCALLSMRQINKYVYVYKYVLKYIQFRYKADCLST